MSESQCVRERLSGRENVCVRVGEREGGREGEGEGGKEGEGERERGGRRREGGRENYRVFLPLIIYTHHARAWN